MISTENIKIINDNDNIVEPWILKIIKRHGKLNEKYEKANEKLSEAWDDFNSEINDINNEFGTTFSVEEVFQKFK